MRLLMWISLGFGAACGLGVYLLPQEALLTVLIAAGSAALGMGLVGIRFRWMRPVAGAALGMCLGMLWFLGYSQGYLSDARGWDGVTRDAVVTAADFSNEIGYGSSVEGYIRIEGKPVRIRVYLRETSEIAPGDLLSGRFRFDDTAPGTGERTSRLQGKGVFLTARQRGDVAIEKSAKTHWWQYPPKLARTITQMLEQVLPGDVLPFVRALLLGDSSKLDFNTDMDLKISGIRHVVAVSGLHAGVLYKLVELLTSKRRFLTALVGFPVMVMFAAMAGFTPSVTRACIMVGLMMAARVVDREYDSLTALAFACLVMLMANPYLIGNVSFQLSAASVSGILLFCESINSRLQSSFPKWNGFLWRWVRGSIAVTLSAMVLTVPLSAMYFGTVSLIGPVTNLLTLWVVTGIFCCAAALCAVSLISSAAAGVLGWLLAWPVRYVLLVAKLLSRIPLAAVYTDNVYIVPWLVFCYTLIAVLCLSKMKHCRVALCGVCIGLCLCLGCSWLETRTDGFRVTMVDVGQGQCILLQSKGKTFLVDCGGDTDEIAAERAFRALAAQGIRRLDGIILTHGDDDHSGGLSYLLGCVQTEAIYAPGLMDPEVLTGIDAETIWVSEERSLDCGVCGIRIFPPTGLKKENENGLAILFEGENCGILITGDRSDIGEWILIKQHTLPQTQFLVAGHHGAKTSVTQELLNVVRPETVLISVGEGNSYGHPDPETLARLANFGCDVYRTDQNGTIVIRRR